MLIGNAAKAPRRINDSGFVILELLGKSSTVSEIPHSHLVELPKGRGLVQPPHFHEIDQYQMVMAGSGRIGATPLQAGGYHYTDRATPYGPIVGDEEGITYLVLRPRGEPGVDISARKMPESRHLRSRRPGRHLYGNAVTDSVVDAWQVASDSGDGGRVMSMVVSPEAYLPEPDRSDSGPGYIVVLRGSFLHDDADALPTTSVIWIESDDNWPALSAGADGGTAVWFAFSHAHVPLTQ